MKMTGVDMGLVGETFNSSLIDVDDIDLTYYLSAYDELYKLCSLVGTIFGFVCSEILGKINVLRELQKADRNGQCATMKSMVAYEMENDLFYQKGYVSGSRTLLRLHRGLEFVLKFLSKVNELELDDDTTDAGKEAYSASLANYHSWIVRKGAEFAMYSLPEKKELLNRVCSNSIYECAKALPEMLESLENVYDRVQRYYLEYKLLDLP